MPTMTTTTGPAWLRHITWRRALAGTLILEAAAAVAFLSTDPAESRPKPARGAAKTERRVVWMENRDRPTVRPRVVPASEATVDDAEPIIGVEVGGEARAYRVGAFDDASGHLVNDMVGGVPVSVAHSNLSGVARVYTDPGGTRPLDAEVTGLLNRRMVVRLGGHSYIHETGAAIDAEKDAPPIPYPLLPPTLTSWGEWKRAHPETRIYVGGR